MRYVAEGWMEFDIGKILVEENEDGTKEVRFHMNKWNGGYQKGGLILEEVKIQPRFLAI